MDPLKKQTKHFSSEQQQRVGIKVYISKGEPIPAVTKFMLTDFVVNQIAENGTVVMLKAKPNVNVNPAKPVVHVKPSYEMNNQVLAEFIGFFGKEAGESLCELYKKLEEGQKIQQWQYTIENMKPMEKEERIKIHSFVREKLINIESNTLDGNKMMLKLNKKMKKINPAARNKYIHFILYKSNIDTMGAIFKLSKITGINQKLFSTAGLKDKRGVTTQLISVYNTERASLQKFYPVAFRTRQIWIQDFKQGIDYDIGVGNLFGNQFGLILRLINPSDAQLIGDRVTSLKEIGMINYFGMQRFGSCGIKTHMIGLKILKKQWKQVVEDLLLENTRDYEVNEIKKDCYEKEEYARGQRALPNKYKNEKNLFKGLKKYGKNFQNVFESMPRSIRTLYPHALQSYMWNRVVSRRIQQHGLKVCIGDLVGLKLAGFDLVKCEAEQEAMIRKQEQEKNKDQIEEQIVEGAEELEEDKYQVEVVTPDNINKYQITDVVMPLYGPLLNLPHNSIAYNYLQHQFQALGIVQQDFNQNSKQLCFKGMYRRMLIKPTNISYKIISHSNAKQQLQSPFYTIGEECLVTPGQKKAVQIVLQLPKSSYATMALRQILHIPSSFECQMTLNQLYQQEKPALINQKVEQIVEPEKQDL